MTQNFTQLPLEFSQNDQASVFFAHLQNVLKDLEQVNSEKNYSKQELLIKKIDQVLYDVFMQYQKLHKQYFNTSKNLKEMLAQCTQLMNECKTDRQQLVKVTQDRQNILEKLKQSTNQSLEIVMENEKLYKELDKMKEINQLLNEKNSVLEEQIQNVSITNKGYQNIVGISKEFEKISKNNVSIQEDIAEILKTTEMYGNASQPLQIMCLAFQEQPNLREQLWNQVNEKHKNKFENIQETKQNFYNFNYIDALLLFSKNSK